jgi:hypothetical protein
MTTDETGPASVEALYGAARYRRLVDLTRRYDPGNLFRLNQHMRGHERTDERKKGRVRRCGRNDVRPAGATSSHHGPVLKPPVVHSPATL